MVPPQLFFTQFRQQHFSYLIYFRFYYITLDINIKISLSLVCCDFVLSDLQRYVRIILWLSDTER